MSINHDIALGIKMQFLIQELVNYKASSPLCNNNNNIIIIIIILILIILILFYFITFLDDFQCY